MTRTMDEMSVKARMLNEAVMERDLGMCRAIIRDTNSKYGAATLVLEAICHIDCTADDADWEWLTNILV